VVEELLSSEEEFPSLPEFDELSSKEELLLSSGDEELSPKEELFISELELSRNAEELSAILDETSSEDVVPLFPITLLLFIKDEILSELSILLVFCKELLLFDMSPKSVPQAFNADMPIPKHKPSAKNLFNFFILSS
jgi:hypothetical protein